MKKISVALAALLMAGGVSAENFTPGTATTVDTAAQTFTYVTTAGNFVVNPFNFTVSANVVVDAGENAASMGVAAAAAKGRNVFTGHSNGGSVSQCGTPIVPTSSTDPTAEVSNRLDIDNIDSCSEKDPIEAAPVGT